MIQADNAMERNKQRQYLADAMRIAASAMIIGACIELFRAAPSMSPDRAVMLLALGGVTLTLGYVVLGFSEQEA